jgi:hypothetical protein
MIKHVGTVVITKDNISIEKFAVDNADLALVAIESMEWAVTRLNDHIKIIKDNGLSFDVIDCDGTMLSINKGDQK